MKLQHNEISTVIPASWEDRTMLTLIAPFDEAIHFAANIVITRHPVKPNESLEDFVGEQLEMLRESLPNFELLDRANDTLNGYPSSRQLHRFQTEAGFLQQVQTFVLSNQNIYAITGTATVEDFNKHIQAFRKVVENFFVSGER